MDDPRVTVSVDDEHLPAIETVVAELSAHGMQVDQVLAMVGLVTGRAHDAAALRTVAGVVSVDAETRVQLPPPEEDVQ